MKRNLLPFILITLFASTNCKKEKSGSQNILGSKTWKIALNDKNPSTTPPGAVTYYVAQNCQKDDTFKFGQDGKLTINRNADKCDPNEAESQTQTYTIDRTTKKLTINGTTYVLAEESNNQIKYYATISETSGYNYLVFLLE